MQPSKITTLFATLACLASPVLTNPTFIPRNVTSIGNIDLADCVGGGYATFYDDNACSVNGGIPVGLDNGDCLANEIGRNSVYLQAACVGDGQFNMIWSPGNECNCQNHCAHVPTENSALNSCWDLAGNPGANSFRFVEGRSCGADNC